MYENFRTTDHWTGEELHCVWKGTVVAIATRHADATDIIFSVNGRPLTIALPNTAWVEMKKNTGHVITDRAAAQAAGKYLKSIIDSGYSNGRDFYSMTVQEVLDNVNAVVNEAGSTGALPALPVINDNIEPETYAGGLPADQVTEVVTPPNP